MKIYLLLILGMAVLILTLPSATQAQETTPRAAVPSYADSQSAWRAERAEELKKEGGWLSVSGLHWLENGKNTLGTGRSNDFVLPTGSAPESVGVITLQNRTATLKVSPGVVVNVNGKPVVESELKSDKDNTPDKVTIGALTFGIIERGKRIGIRLWDSNSPTRKGFTGLKWYPIDESYRITAKFVPYDKPKKVKITNVLGDMEEATVSGYVVFHLNGKEYRLDPQSEDDGLFINFADLTSGETTYAAGRFLYTSLPKNGQVVLDFNRAVNPPCAFTAFATCPLPPAHNHLKVAIPAGEKKYHG